MSSKCHQAEKAKYKRSYSADNYTEVIEGYNLPFCLVFVNYEKIITTTETGQPSDWSQIDRRYIKVLKG